MERLCAPVPRHLRVRASVTIGNTRVSARAFLLAVGLLVGGALAVLMGAALTPTVQCLGVLLVGGLLLLEGRVWGRSIPAVGRIMLRHLRRPRHMRRVPILRTLPTDDPKITPARRPRWQRKTEVPR